MDCPSGFSNLGCVQGFSEFVAHNNRRCGVQKPELPIDFNEADMTYNVNDFDSLDVVNNDREHVWHHLTQHKPFEKNDPMVIVKGEGMRVWDAKGNEYLDAVSGAVWTVNVGYGRTEIADAVRDQLVEMNYFAQNGRVMCLLRCSRKS